jgi:hypothetical protein
MTCALKLILYFVPLFQPLPKKVGLSTGGYTYMYLAWAYWQAGQTLLNQGDPEELEVVKMLSSLI